MNCPHCGANQIGSDPKEFECGAEIWSDFQSIPADCYERQISQLKAELARCVRRDDPRLKEAMEIVAGMPMMAIVCPPVRQSREVCTILQSIIEGK